MARRADKADGLRIFAPHDALDGVTNRAAGKSCHIVRFGTANGVFRNSATPRACIRLHLGHVAARVNARQPLVRQSLPRGPRAAPVEARALQVSHDVCQSLGPLGMTTRAVL